MMMTMMMKAWRFLATYWPHVCGPARQLTPDWPPKIGDQHHPRWDGSRASGSSFSSWHYGSQS